MQPTKFHKLISQSCTKSKPSQKHIKTISVLYTNLPDNTAAHFRFKIQITTKMNESTFRPLKVILVGSSGVGKTSLINAFFDQPFDSDPQPTVAPAFCCSTVQLPSGAKVDLHIWDTAGQEKFQSIGSMFYRDSDVAFVCFDTDTVGTIPNWISKVRAQVPDCAIFLVMTKEDLLPLSEKDRLLSDSRQLIEENGAEGFFFTSAATGNGVANLFAAAGRCAEQLSANSKPATIEIRTEESSACMC